MAKVVGTTECPCCGATAEIKEEVRGKALYVKCGVDTCKYYCQQRGRDAQAKLRAIIGGVVDAVDSEYEAVADVVTAEVVEVVEVVDKTPSKRRWAGGLMALVGLLGLFVGAKF